MSTAYEQLQANSTLRDLILPVSDYPTPAPFCVNRDTVKAIVLGADPSNFSDGGKTNKLSTVFDLANGPNKYFKGPMQGLKALELSLEQVYVQNLIQNYCILETGTNKYWKDIASYWVIELKRELDELDPSRQIPVLLTAEILYHFLLNKGEWKYSALEFYSCKVPIPVRASQNKLERPLIPFYRYNRGKVNYWLSNPEWVDYASAVKSFIQGEASK